MIDLSTRYLGLPLASPLVASSSPLCESVENIRAMEDAGAIAQGMRAALARRSSAERGKVLGPAPAPLGRLKGEHRAQLFVKGTQRNAMRKALLAVLDARPEIKRRTIVDVDPASVL